MKTTQLVITVDVNDGDYETYNTEITEANGDTFDKFIAALKYLPTEENYYYDRHGKKVVTGNVIRFANHQRVGHDAYYDTCGLKSLVLDDDICHQENLSIDDVHEDGCITEQEYLTLCEFLPMWLEGGFHTIISVQLEEHTAPVVLLPIKL